MTKIRILITGTGGLGQEILKATRRINLPQKIICVDANVRSPGLYRGDAAYLVPQAHERQYVPRLLQICRSEKIQALLIGTQQELEPLAQAKEKFFAQGTQVVVADYSALKVAADKYLLTQYLKSYQLVVPATVLMSDQPGVASLVKQRGFPLFSKARNLSGSKGAQIINHMSELKTLPKENVLQQYLGEGYEYTAGCYLTKKNQFYFILLRRQLFRGTGLSGEVLPATSLEAKKYCRQIVSKLSLSGPINIQLKIIRGRPIVFEINPRFSSTTSIQAGLGMNFVHLALAEALNLPLPQMRCTLKLVLRYFNEAYIPLQQVRNLQQRHRFKSPKSLLEDNF